MNKSVFFDHIEVHVDDIPRYCEFLYKMFHGGRYKVISNSGTSMFVSNDGINIELKKRKEGVKPSGAGFCNPCLRMENAKDFIENELGFVITLTTNNPDGNCYFFDDHESITWHIKEYLIRDLYINW
jgi:hypothetical protein